MPKIQYMKSTGIHFITIPKWIIHITKWKKGDELYFDKTTRGEITVKHVDPKAFEESPP